MTMHAFLFEAKSIQSYLFATSRLRDLIGGSELVEGLTAELLDRTLSAADLSTAADTASGDIVFSRRAGGALYAFAEDPDKLARFARLWTLAVQQYAPGLAFDIGYGHGDDELAAFDDARQALRADGSRRVPMRPVAPPVAERSPRTGLAAVARERKQDRQEAVDAAAERKRSKADPAHSQLMEKATPKESGYTWRNWPRNLDAGETDGGFPFIGGEQKVALLHADGNGFGQLLRQVAEAVKKDPGTFTPVFRALSDDIGKVTAKAVRTAVAEVLIPASKDRDKGQSDMLPARPIVIGGDDVTFLLRADVALPFLRVFAREFEIESEKTLAKLGSLGVDDLPDRLTVGAGIVYMGARQPFHMAAGLAEDLTKAAKKRAKTLEGSTPASSVVFHRVTTSLIDDYADIVERELTQRWGEETYVQTLGAYALLDQGAGSDGSGDALPGIDPLIAIQELLEDERMARGPARQLLGLIGLDPGQASQRYRRWRTVMAARSEQKALLDQFDDLLGGLAPSCDWLNDMPYYRHAEGVLRTPLGDALALSSAGNSMHGTHAAATPEEA